MLVNVVWQEKIISLEAEPTAPISHLKQVIEDAIAMPQLQQILSFMHEDVKIVLDSAATLDQYPIESNAELLLEEGPSALTQAVLASSQNNLEALRVVLDSVPNPAQIANTLQNSQWNCMHYACHSGFVQVVQALLEVEADVNKATGDGWTPLQLACYSGHIEVVTQLLGVRGIQVNKLTSRTALHAACQAGNKAIVELLFQHGANQNITDAEHKFPIELTDNLEICDLIAIQTGKDMLGKSWSLQPPPNFSGVVGYEQPDLGTDSSVFLVLKTDKNYFAHFASQRDYLDQRKPQVKASVASIKTVSFKELHQRQYFFVVCQHKTLRYFTEFTELTHEWVSAFQNAMDFVKLVPLQSPESTELGMNAFEQLQELGSGSFGTVSLVKAVNSGEMFALKKLNKARLEESGHTKYAMAESKLLTEIQHPFIVKLHGHFETETEFCVVLEYCSQGDLEQYIRKHGRLSEAVARTFSSQILLALDYLHSKGIVYRDLKPSNVLLDAEGFVKLTDFGLATETASAHSPAQTFCGSLAYFSPEQVQNKGAWQPTDMYALGATLYEMLVGVPPFYIEDPQALCERIETEELAVPQNISPDARDLIEALMDKVPERRPSTRQARLHDFFSEVDWQAVYNKEGGA